MFGRVVFPPKTFACPHSVFAHSLPQPLSPSGRERGAKQPHLISSLRLGFYWSSTCGYACDIYTRRRRRDGFTGLGAAVFEPGAASS